MSTVVLRVRGLSAAVERRTVVVSVCLAVLALALAFLGLSQGANWSTPGEVFASLTGGEGGSVVVREWRLPRVTAALVFGASLGLAGAVFQNLTRNALGSPDVIGLDAGAYTGALVALTILSGTSAQLAAGAVVGGLLAASAIYLLALDSGLSGLRLVVIGIAVNAILTAVNSWIVLRADLDIAIAATGWSAGSLNGVDWDELHLPLLAIGVLVVVLALLSRGMHQSGLGDELAVTSGIRLGRLRLLLIVVGVGCTATVTAVAGPIVFIALAAPQIGRRLARSGVALLPAALTGAVLLLAADLVAQLLLAPAALPVGVVTTAIGGCYLIWLLVLEVKRR
ncbi:iron-enterobactin ABC transporter permease [Dactylosporangium fulvum]|uniref:Iron chelate uptake ABC transporter family permease subunit n=1 Tax=Dactylosporangium fulvum TaxID=53359 RepID=A0ABY5WBS0_9ACTN|nr:iron chelate uptake ABC transporter family permease subunit [Dactylosporangium fulvum]UWP86982.1 iron chelate uptake ABC transporter family permease subunit [Dactylosporangium fulvum]